MEPRGSIDVLPKDRQYTADEAVRHAGGLSVAHTGYRFQNGDSCCLVCFPTVRQQLADRGRGYRMSVYRSKRPEALARCFACSVPFPGETAQETLDLRLTAAL